MKLSFPEKYTPIIEKQLNRMGYSLNDLKTLAPAVIQLSDLYNSRQIPESLWQKPIWMAAYLIYFFPLNYLRAVRSIKLAQQMGFFRDITHWLELGSGCGTAFFAYLDTFASHNLKEATFIETSPHANQLMKEIWRELNYEKNFASLWLHHYPANYKATDLSLFITSYALNELQELPTWLNQHKNIFILESSLQQQTRQLMNLRQKLLDQNYYAWAPCTHQEACPLVSHSQKDWCFDRFFIEMPSWFDGLEKHLPMKNRSLTYSYLAMATRPPLVKTGWGRLIGDTLIEKGKTKQAYCQNSEREFLTWLKKEGPPPSLSRGLLLHLKSAAKKGNELRPQQAAFEILDLDKPLSP